MGDDVLNELTNVTFRSLGQTKFLLDLLDNDFKKLIELEEKIKNLFIHYCPGDRKECDKILQTKVDKKIWFMTFALKTK